MIKKLTNGSQKRIYVVDTDWLTDRQEGQYIKKKKLWMGENHTENININC